MTGVCKYSICLAAYLVTSFSQRRSNQHRGVRSVLYEVRVLTRLVAIREKCDCVYGRH